jgi:hypothetical protein
MCYYDQLEEHQYLFTRRKVNQNVEFFETS